MRSARLQLQMTAVVCVAEIPALGKNSNLRYLCNRITSSKFSKCQIGMKRFTPDIFLVICTAIISHLLR